MQAKMHQNKNQNQNRLHEPVLAREVLTYLAPREGESYLDTTAGYGGHASAVLAATAAPEKAVLVDRDQDAVNALHARFAAGKVGIRHQDFLAASRQLQAEGKQFDMILADLGVSSPHLNEGDRGFAFATTGPLDMRMDQSQELTAGKIVNTWSEADIRGILERYGEEPKAAVIARLIVHHRPLETTTELAELIKRAWPAHSRMHPATRTFQALRIAVNDELKQVEMALPVWFELLKPGGRLAVISFHSLEDRLVKRAFAAVAGERYDAELRLLTKRPVTATPAETVSNPRARSARLRAAVKIKIKEGNTHAYPGKK